MKNPWKTCHPFCWVHRVYGMQNDRLDLTVILVEKNCEKMHCIQRFLHFFVHFSSLVLQISRDTMHFLAIFFSKNDREIEPVVLHTINPMNSTKWVTSFSWIFDFSLIDFSKKIFEFFFHKCLLLWEYVELFTRSKKEKLFLGEIWLPPQNARTRVRLLYGGCLKWPYCTDRQSVDSASPLQKGVRSINRIRLFLCCS